MNTFSSGSVDCNFYLFYRNSNKINWTGLTKSLWNSFLTIFVLTSRSIDFLVTYLFNFITVFCNILKVFYYVPIVDVESKIWLAQFTTRLLSIYVVRQSFNNIIVNSVLNWFRWSQANAHLLRLTKIHFTSVCFM